MDELVRWAMVVAAGAAGGAMSVRVFWRVRSSIKRLAGSRALRSVRHVIWRDPGAVETLDLASGPGGPDGMPRPPLRFVEEHFGGSQPCVSVRDGVGRLWRVKWGDEVRAEALATRLAWAAGYFVETTYYVAHGRIEGVPPLQRAAACVDADGCFTEARFEREEERVITHFEEHSWAWNDNPFVGSRELNGLKILVMLLSNWDAKDVRDVARGSNTAIFEYDIGRGRREARYLITDWGGALGRWGTVVNRGRWDCAGFAKQSARFVTGVDGDRVVWGYSGQRTSDIAEGITVADVRWLLRTLGRITPRQILAAICASGGTGQEARCFTRALIQRIDQLRQVAGGPQTINPSSTPADALSSAVASILSLVLHVY